MTFYEKLQRIDRRIIYLIFFLITAYPMINPIPTPINLNPMHIAIYDAVEALEPGDVAVISLEYSASMVGELSPPLIAVMEHYLMQPDIKIIIVANSADAIMFSRQLVEMAEGAGLVYGEDIANLGYAPGEEGTIAAFAEDIHSTYPVDYYGNLIETLPMMAEIKTADDLSLIVQFTGGGLGPLGWIRQVQMPYGTPIASIMSSVMLPSAVPYWQAGQLVGLGNGLRAGAEYEFMVQKYGKATASMTAESFLHIYTILLVLLANFGFVMQRRSQKGGAGR